MGTVCVLPSFTLPAPAPTMVSAAFERHRRSIVSHSFTSKRPVIHVHRITQEDPRPE